MTKSEAKLQIRRLMNKTGWGPARLVKEAKITETQMKSFFYSGESLKLHVFYAMQDALMNALKEKPLKS